VQATILYLDADLLALAKPPGLSLATPRRDPHAAVARLLAALGPDDRRLLAETAVGGGGDPGAPLLVHRLDVGTTGVVLLARHPEAHRELLRALGEREIGKTYLALVWGHPRPRVGRYDQPLGPDRRDRRRMRVDPEGRPALTHYRVLAAPPHVAVVELELETGRTHQIRVHLAAAGHPIVGDDLYGGPREHGIRSARLRTALTAPHPLLHARRLTLPPPWDLVLTAPLPPAFRRALEACMPEGEPVPAWAE
jgi:23S rRNA pseudouridine1911/1915/1917 synthase